MKKFFPFNFFFPDSTIHQASRIILVKLSWNQAQNKAEFSLHQLRFIFLSKRETVFSYELLQNKLLSNDPGYPFE